MLTTLAPKTASTIPAAGTVLLGSSAAIRAVQAMIRRIAPTDLTVLLAGETLDAQAMQRLAEESLPEGMETVLTGEARQLQQTSNDIIYTFIFAIIVVVLVPLLTFAASKLWAFAGARA